MIKIGRLKNTVQEYAWGSHTAIAELLGEPSPSNTPQAEIWMGAHPRGASMAEFDDAIMSLPDLVKKYPNEILGKVAAEKFSDGFPYLFKVLAAAKPLSIQAHPNRFQARQGFKKENDKKIEIDAHNRNYKDENHKPECICALTDFWALNGFRKIPEILSYMNRISSGRLDNELKALEMKQDSNGLKKFFSEMMTLDLKRKQQIIDTAVTNAAGMKKDDMAFGWIVKLHDEYPGDIGVLSPIILNLICLKPGEALFLQAGELHAYLDGVGIELMANSDNVLRGGLTPKHIDVPELLKVLNFKEKEMEILIPEEVRPCELAYPGKADEFVLSVIRVNDQKTYSSPLTRSVEILLCTEGTGTVRSSGQEESMTITKGTSILVPAAVKNYSISGKAVLYKAAVPV